MITAVIDPASSGRAMTRPDAKRRYELDMKVRTKPSMLYVSHRTVGHRAVHTDIQNRVVVAMRYRRDDDVSRGPSDARLSPRRTTSVAGSHAMIRLKTSTGRENPTKK